MVDAGDVDAQLGATVVVPTVDHQATLDVLRVGKTGGHQR